MSLYLKQTETRSQLQEKLAKELQERAKQKSQEHDLPDGVTDSAYLEGTQQTKLPAWVWGIVVLGVLAILVWLLASSI